MHREHLTRATTGSKRVILCEGETLPRNLAAIAFAGLQVTRVAVPPEAENASGRWPRADVYVLYEVSSSWRRLQHLVDVLRKRHPETCIILCSDRWPTETSDLRSAARAGIDDVFGLGSDLAAKEVNEFVHNRLLASVPGEIISELDIAIRNDEMSAMFLWLVRNSYRLPSAAAASSQLGWSQRTMNRRLADARFPSLAFTVRVGKLCHAAQLRRETSLSREEIAIRVGCGGAAALGMHRLRTKRWTGQPQRLRRIFADALFLSL